MPAEILDGRALAAELRAAVLARSTALRAERQVTPRLAVVVAGEDASSLAYVRSIERIGRQTGVEILVDRFPVDVAPLEVHRRLQAHGADPRVHGLMIQQPLPPQLSIRALAEDVPVDKDVDGANPINEGRLAFGSGSAFVPATPAAVMLLLERSSAWPLRGREVVIVGRSSVVGLPVALLALRESATVTLVHRQTREMAAHTRRADVVIVATGRPGLIDGAMLRQGSVVIDVGTTVVDGKLVGDVAFESAAQVAREITPVPGGVGPVTNVVLMRNVVTAAERLATAPAVA